MGLLLEPGLGLLLGLRQWGCVRRRGRLAALLCSLQGGEQGVQRL
jgi:hypothetical protein